ncbi:hypothetical protein BX600DRAFT_469036 [Xylariales sp. PMI_506]|nr:hypothetical protein BX600DRAFT_469036 [Xylariales sp. PMI_506]
MKPEHRLPDDEEHLLGTRSGIKLNRKTRGLTLCQKLSIGPGVVLLFALGTITGLLGFTRVPWIQQRLFPPTNSTQDLQELQDLPPVVLPTVFGTNESTDFIIPTTTPQFSLVGADLEAVLLDDTKQPTIPRTGNDGCGYAHRPQLTFQNGRLPLADFLRPSNRLEIDDIIQGSIGDCGFGASLLSLIANGQRQEISDALVRKSDPSLMVAQFFVPDTETLIPNAPAIVNTKAVRFIVDDSLATRDPFIDNSPCPEYISFSPSVVDSRRIAFVPLLEKAFAKFLDANPDLKINQDGYGGLTGIVARNVLQSITGGTARIYERFSPGLDLDMASFFVKCINMRRACVLGVPPATDPRLGTAVNGNIDTPAGQITINSGSKTFTLREIGTNRDITIIGQHYYGIERTQPIDGKLITFDNAEVTLHNPWGCNVDPNSELSCAAGVPRSFRVKLSSLPIIGTGVEWADPINL